MRSGETGAEFRTIKGFEERVHYLVFSPDGSRLLGADVSGVLKIWDVATGRETTTTRLSDIYITRIRFSPDGKRLAVVGCHSRFLVGAVRILDAERGGDALPPLGGHTRVVQDVVFSLDGQRLATGSTDRTIRIWDLATGQEILTLKGHAGIVWTIRFSPDGRRLISASMDQTVRVWDATPLSDEPIMEKEKR